MNSLHRSLLTLLAALLCSLALAQFSGADLFICAGCPFPLVADMNNDGHEDLVFSAADEDSIVWMENPGDGSFASATYLTDNPYHLTFSLAADIDGNGFVDLVGVTYSGDGYTDSTVAVLTQVALLQFEVLVIDTSVACISGIDQATDLDTDGDLDLLTLDGAIVDLWFRNDGPGLYSRQELRDWCQDAMATEYVPIDVDGDSDMDLAYYDGGVHRLMVLYNLGDGVFGPPTPGTPVTGTDSAYPLGRVDQNNDGLMDLVIGSWPFVSQGNGTFARVGTGDPSGYTSQSIASVNCAVGPDAIVSGQGAVMRIRRLDNPTSPFTIALNDTVRTLVADLNGDLRPDVLLLDTEDSLTWRTNNAVPAYTSLDLLLPDTLSSGVFALSGGSPSGGFYTGTGVFDDSLYVATAPNGWVNLTYHYSALQEADSCPGQAVDSIYITGVTYVETHPSGGVSIAPNPADDRLVVGGMNAAYTRFLVIDALGRQQRVSISEGARLADRVTLDIEDLAQGIHRLLLFREDAPPLVFSFCVLH